MGMWQRRVVRFTGGLAGWDPGQVEMRSGRSLARIGSEDLVRLAGLAAEAGAGLFARHPQGAGRYAGRLVCRALCQGAALHHLDGRNGVKDFDVWSCCA